jgi:hypothetical protein
MTDITKVKEALREMLPLSISYERTMAITTALTIINEWEKINTCVVCECKSTLALCDKCTIKKLESDIAKMQERLEKFVEAEEGGWC